MQRHLCLIGPDKVPALLYTVDDWQLSSALRAVEIDRGEKVQWMPNIQRLDDLLPTHEKLTRFYLNTERGVQQFRLAQALSYQETLRRALIMANR